jgi:ferrochelatase
VSSTPRPIFDAVLLISFGGPQGPADIRPFLANVLRGRRVTAERVEEVVHHYELFGGVSPITELTMAQANGLRLRLASCGQALPVYVGMRNWHPYLADTFRQMYDEGVRRVVGFITSPFHSYSSCQQYRENVAAARADLRASRAGGDIEVTYVESWFTHPGFIEANAVHVEQALARLPTPGAADARIVFTAHSIPQSMAERSLYREELAAASSAVAARVGREWALVYQSRSGRPEDPWLGPDVCDYLRAETANGLSAAVIAPIGFVCDHIEVLYDLDHEAAAVCRELGLPMQRAASVNLEPVFLDAMTDMVTRTLRRYTGRPVPVVSAEPATAAAQPTRPQSGRR